MDLNELKRLYEETIAKRNGILETIKGREDKSFTDEERSNFDVLTEKGGKIFADIQRIENLRADETKRLQGGQKQRHEIKDFGEFLSTARFNPGDSTLEVRGQSMGVGDEGGFAIPDQFIPAIREVSIDQAIFRPRCTVLPAGSPPDGKISFPALDQSTAYGMYAGIEVSWIGEGETKPETDLRLREVELQPQEVAASLFITDKLLRNAPAVGALCQKMMRAAIIGAEEDTFFQGNGVAKPLGLTNSPATLPVNRAVPGTIGYVDLVNMLANFRGGNSMSPDQGSAVFIAHRQLLPVLMQMTDAVGNLIWQTNAREGSPGSLLGYPLLFNDMAPVLGGFGDLCLLDLSYYLIKDGSGPALSMSEHVRFRQNQTCIKIFWNVDGKSWLNTPLLQRDGVTQVSPFIMLQ